MLPATFKLCAAISYRHLRKMTGEGPEGRDAGLGEPLSVGCLWWAACGGLPAVGCLRWAACGGQRWQGSQGGRRLEAPGMLSPHHAMSLSGFFVSLSPQPFLPPDRLLGSEGDGCVPVLNVESNYK